MVAPCHTVAWNESDDSEEHPCDLPHLPQADAMLSVLSNKKKTWILVMGHPPVIPALRMLTQVPRQPGLHSQTPTDRQ